MYPANLPLAGIRAELALNVRASFAAFVKVCRPGCASGPSCGMKREMHDSVGGRLRYIADTYEQAQKVRITTGERIRAVVQGRDGGGSIRRTGDVDALLRYLRSGRAKSGSEFLETVYQLHWRAEEAARGAMADALRDHPAWPWMSGVKGIGPTLACRLLARLDIERARTPSSFWAYCGLATVPGVEYSCQECGRVVAQPEHYRVTGRHLRLGSRARCPGLLLPRRHAADGIRVAQPPPAAGVPSSYDVTAKVICHLICTSFLRTKGSYADHYAAVRADLTQQRPGWEKGRVHLSASRRTQKRFLADLWITWRSRLGLPTNQPHPGAVSPPDPWSMSSTSPSQEVAAA
jgi:hypothetical protein